MHSKQQGFTLLEILVALFIFTILSMLLMSGLHHIINLQSGVEANAERLRKLQLALLVMSRDIEQAINRPVLNRVGKEEAAFIGTPSDITLTHAGFANSLQSTSQSTLQRTRYIWNENIIWRTTWDVLDQSTGSKSHTKQLLTNVAEMRFEYLDKEGRFHNQWIGSQVSEPIPQAVKIVLTLSKWGKLSQLYVISIQCSKNTSTSKS